MCYESAINYITQKYCDEIECDFDNIDEDTKYKHIETVKAVLSAIGYFYIVKCGDCNSYWFGNCHLDNNEVKKDASCKICDDFIPMKDNQILISTIFRFQENKIKTLEEKLSKLGV